MLVNQLSTKSIFVKNSVPYLITCIKDMINLRSFKFRFKTNKFIYSIVVAYLTLFKAPIYPNFTCRRKILLLYSAANLIIMPADLISSKSLTLI